MVIGLIAAIPNLDDLPNNYVQKLIVSGIQCGEFDVLMFYLKLLGFTTLLFVVCFLLSFNFYVFYLNFLAVIIYSKYYFVYAFSGCALNGFAGFVLLFLLWLPLILVIMWYYAKFFISIQSLLFTCCKKLIVPYSCNWGAVKKMFLSIVLPVLIITFVWTGVFLIIFSLIF
ncbi:MAG TPA: hypothetical protein PKY53_01105 [Clostridia bacterium]|nr:hypothetical protein [Clostridia bacterium]